jgi:hypothetical protein
MPKPKTPANHDDRCAHCRAHTEAELKKLKVQCEGTSTKQHAHAFGTRVDCRCSNRAKRVIDGLYVCGRCAKNPRKWRGLT